MERIQIRYATSVCIWPQFQERSDKANHDVARVRAAILSVFHLLQALHNEFQ